MRFLKGKLHQHKTAHNSCQLAGVVGLAGVARVVGVGLARGGKGREGGGVAGILDKWPLPGVASVAPCRGLVAGSGHLQGGKKFL